MARYNISVVLTISPAGGQDAVPEAVEAEKVADFRKAVKNLGNEFGVVESVIVVHLGT